MFDVSFAFITAVDWASLAWNGFYAAPARQTKEVGRFTAELIDYLCERGASIANFHLIGHSLGEICVPCAFSFILLTNASYYAQALTWLDMRGLSSRAARFHGSPVICFLIENKVV